MLRRLLVGVSLLLACCYIQSQEIGNAWHCRGSNPKASVPYCGLPYAATNSYGWFRCSEKVTIGRPKSIEELLRLIQLYPKVKGAGVGHSWWKEQACSGSDSDAINIVITEFPEVLSLSQRLPETYKPFSKEDIQRVPIQVNEDDFTARVAGGVGQRVLLDWLAAYRTKKSPTGYVLLAFSQYIDQTIAGALATGTHGSTVVDGSLSSQIVSLDIAIANGTVVTLTPQSHPHLWRAAQIGIGRLGIITSATFKVQRNLPVRRGLLKGSFAAFASKLLDVQNTYNAAATTAEIERALAPVNLLQSTWYIRTNELWQISFEPLRDESDPDYVTALKADLLSSTEKALERPITRAKASINGALAYSTEQLVANSLDASTAITGSPSAAYKQVTSAVKLKPDVGFDIVSAANAGEPLAKGIFFAVTDYPTTKLAREAYIAANEFLSKIYSGLMPLGNAHAQYELAIPLERAGDCFAKINEFLYINKTVNLSAFTYFSQVRFVNEEAAYISPTNVLFLGGPRVFLNLEDHNSFNAIPGPAFNADFHRLVGFINDTCKPRFHWGKAGWPRYFSCFDGVSQFPQTWCDFGCAVQDLDPSGKFSSESDVWKWRATDQSQMDVPLSTCCTAEGFDKTKCTCAHRTDCIAGPPKPCVAEC